MRLGVHLPVAGKGASPEIILQVAVEGSATVGSSGSARAGWSWG